MSNVKNEKLIIPVKKPKNPNALSPLMRKGGAFDDHKKGNRRKDNALAADIKNAKAFTDDENYGFNP